MGNHLIATHQARPPLASTHKDKGMELSMLSVCPESQPYAGLLQKQHDEQVKGGDLATLLW